MSERTFIGSHGMKQIKPLFINMTSFPLLLLFTVCFLYTLNHTLDWNCTNNICHCEADNCLKNCTSFECMSTTFLCTANDIKSCQVLCTGEYACFNSLFFMTPENYALIACDGYHSCNSADIYCGFPADITSVVEYFYSNISRNYSTSTHSYANTSCNVHLSQNAMTDNGFIHCQSSNIKQCTVDTFDNEKAFTNSKFECVQSANSSADNKCELNCSSNTVNDSCLQSEFYCDWNECECNGDCEQLSKISFSISDSFAIYFI